MFHIMADGRSIYDPLDETLRLLSPKLTVEIGKAGSLEFSIPVTHYYYSSLNQLTTTISVDFDDIEIFRGRILSISRNFNNTKKVYCEGDLSYLVDSVQKCEQYTGMTHDLFRKIIERHNSRVEESKRFTVGNIGVENRSIVLTGQSDDINIGDIDYKQIAINSIVDEWNNTFDFIKTCLIDYEGGYLQTRRVGNTVYLDWAESFGGNSVQEIEFGRNLLDINEDISAEDIFTVLIPLGDDNLTITSVNNGSDELVDATAVACYGRIIRTHVFSNVNQASTLLENAQRYLASNINVPVSITVKAVDLHVISASTSPILVGNRVKVNSFPHGFNDYLTCTRIDYDLSNPGNTRFTFGNPKQSLTERYREDKRLDNDTYGNSGGSGGVSSAGAASAAASSAAGTADKKAEKDLSDFFDAWINVDPNSSHIDLGTLYKQVEDGKTVLKRDCGIDIDGITGNINIRSFKQQYDETAHRTSENEAKIEVLTKDTKSQITLVTSRINDVSDREKQHYAEMKIWADDTESQINLKADKVTVDALGVSLNATDQKINNTNDVLTRQCGIDLSATTGNVNIKSLYIKVDENGKAIQNNSARITENTNSLQAKIDINAKSISSQGTRIANVEVKANSLESSISLKADKVTLNAKVIDLQGQIDTLSARVANINSLFTNGLKATVIEANTIVGQHIIIGGGDNYAVSYNALNNRLSSYVTKYTFNHHTHSNYASSSHTHSQYALKSHTH